MLAAFLPTGVGEGGTGGQGGGGSRQISGALPSSLLSVFFSHFLDLLLSLSPSTSVLC